MQLLYIYFQLLNNFIILLTRFFFLNFYLYVFKHMIIKLMHIRIEYYIVVENKKLEKLSMS